MELAEFTDVRYEVEDGLGRHANDVAVFLEQDLDVRAVAREQPPGRGRVAEGDLHFDRSRLFLAFEDVRRDPSDLGSAAALGERVEGHAGRHAGVNRRRIDLIDRGGNEDAAVIQEIDGR